MRIVDEDLPPTEARQVLEDDGEVDLEDMLPMIPVVA